MCDLWHDHILFTGNAVTGLIDFGSVKEDHVAVDLARLLGSMIGDDAAIWEVGLSAYQRIQPLSAEEAALARDPLSSQGIGISCSEALYVSSIERDSDLAMFEARQAEQRQVHLAALETMIAGCLFSTEATWRDYAAFVAKHAQVTLSGLGFIEDNFDGAVAEGGPIAFAI